jgi:hypothetical protein
LRKDFCGPKVSAVVDALEELLDGRASVLFFRSEGNLTHKQKEDIYRKARIAIEKLEERLKQLLLDQSLADSSSLDKICCSVRQVRRELGEAREKSREEIYSKMNNVGTWHNSGRLPWSSYQWDEEEIQGSHPSDLT